MSTIRLTAAQAMVRYIVNQKNADGDPFIAGCWAIFGHGNVAGLGEALHGMRDELPTYRGHNEQTMAHAAIAYAKQLKRKRAMMVTSSIGPGATNMVTAAALAHANRLPLLLVPGDVFGTRGPDPVLQQIEDFGDGTVTANDCFKPVSRYFDRITRPEQLMTALPRAFDMMLDPANCGPATIAFCQDIQAHAYDFPESFFAPRIRHMRRTAPDAHEINAAVEVLKAAKNPVILAGGGVHYSDAEPDLLAFAEKHQIAVVETQAGKSNMPWDHPLNFGPVGVTGSSSANTLCSEADVILGVGSRFQDFTTGSWDLFKNPDRTLISLNVQAYDAAKHNAMPVMADARSGLAALTKAFGGFKAPAPDAAVKAKWFADTDPLLAAPADSNALPTDMQVVGAVQRSAGPDTVVMSAAGTMPAELHKLWKAGRPMSYHMEYGFSCMGYEIAGALAIKMAEPDRDVICFTGDGTYMMANSELATAAMMGIKITLVITDNRGFGCINRLQMATGGEEFNNLLDTSHHAQPSAIDFVAHTASMGATSVKAANIAELESALEEAKAATGPFAIVIDTDPYPATQEGGNWWEVAIPEVSVRPAVQEARASYEKALAIRNAR